MNTHEFASPDFSSSAAGNVSAAATNSAFAAGGGRARSVSPEFAKRVELALEGVPNGGPADSGDDPRRAYSGQTLLTKATSLQTDTWQSGLNNNVLVLGSSGGGKTRHHVKPNLMQAQGSYIVLDCKGSLYEEMGPYLRDCGYKVDQLDLTTMGGTVGYDPLHHVRFNGAMPLQQDIISIASAICPTEEHEADPFWPQAAANYLASYITYVFEDMPPYQWNMASVLRVFEMACDGKADVLFGGLENENPNSFAVSLYRRAKSTCRAEKMHASILSIIATDLMPFGFPEALAAFKREPQIDFAEFGHRQCALFVKMSDTDRSLDKLTSMFVRQAFSSLMREADSCPDHRLPVPVRFVLDDFANLNLPHIDDILAVVRSREISATIVCQTVSQIEARYGEATANSIIGNCDAQLVLGFQDDRTATYYSMRANKPASALLETPMGQWWVFVRGQRGRQEEAYRLEDHPGYQGLLELKASAAFEATRMPSVRAVAAPGSDCLSEWYDFEELDLCGPDEEDDPTASQAGEAA